MKRVSLPQRDRRALLVAVIVIPTVVVFGRLVPAARAWSQVLHQHAAITSRALARAEGRVLVQRALFDSLQARKRRFFRIATELLRGTDAGSAVATLAGLVSNAASRAGVRVNAVQPLPLATDDSGSTDTFTTVGVRADITGDIRGVMVFLTALEFGPRHLAVRSFEITQSDPAGPGDRMETLNLTLTIYGLMLTPHQKQ